MLAGRFGVEVPDYLDDYDDPMEVVRVGGALVAPHVRSAPEGPTRERGPRPPRDPHVARTEAPGDVVLMWMRGVPCHVGVVTVPGMMRHVMEGTDSTHESYEGTRYWNALQGVWRRA